MKIVVGASSFAQSSDIAIKMLEQRGIEVVLNPYGRKMSLEETRLHLQDADGILAGLEELNEEIFQYTPKLRVISRIGVGMDNVDFNAAKKRNIKVLNTPDAPTEAVAEMALAALLAIIHKLFDFNNDMHNRIWKKRVCTSLKDLNILLIGYGRIGKLFKRHLEYMGSNIFIYDPYLMDITEEQLNNLLNKSDVISLHASGKQEILTEASFEFIKIGAIILNCARGSLINEEALYKGLKNNKISYYWGDVFEQEPYSGKLTDCQNAILTPHISTYNNICRNKMEIEAVKNILEGLEIV